jgi:hypothetical protein
MTPAESIALKPLQDCVFEMAWEVVMAMCRFDWSQWIIRTPFLDGIWEIRTLDLLRFASLYQASHDDVCDQHVFN